MGANIVTVEDLENFRQRLLGDLQNFVSSKNAAAKKWMKSKEVRALLGISSGTLQTLRKNKTLPFTKIGGVMFYDAEDIDRMIQKRKQNLNGEKGF